MKNLYLDAPEKKYKKSFENYVMSYKKANDEFYFNKYKKAIENFDEYVDDMHKYSRGIDLPEGWVPTSSFWLIDNDEVVGVVRVRHQEIECAGHIGYDIAPDFRNRGYGTIILKLALEKAAELGIEDAIVTCSTENTASRKIIEKNNGNYLETVFDEEDDEFLFKYSISTNSH